MSFPNAKNNPKKAINPTQKELANTPTATLAAGRIRITVRPTHAGFVIVFVAPHDAQTVAPSLIIVMQKGQFSAMSHSPKFKLENKFRFVMLTTHVSVTKR